MRGFMETAREFGREEDAVGVVEIILILVVLISLVIIFKEQLTNLVKAILRLSSPFVDAKVFIWRTLPR